MVCVTFHGHSFTKCKTYPVIKKKGITQPQKENTPVTHFFISSDSMTGSQLFLLTPIHRLVRLLIYESRVFFLKSQKSRSSSLKTLNCLPSQLPLKCRCNATTIWVHVFGRYGVQSFLLISKIFRCIQQPINNIQLSWAKIVSKKVIWHALWQ